MTELIPYSEFGQLRLADFAPPGEPVDALKDWEYLGERWVGEALGAFTEFLRLERDPEVVRAVALDLGALPAGVAGALLGALRLPLAPGLPADAVAGRLGATVSERAFVADRRDYEFVSAGPQPYQVSCTIHQTRGLIYVTVVVPPSEYPPAGGRAHAA